MLKEKKRSETGWTNAHAQPFRHTDDQCSVFQNAGKKTDEVITKRMSPLMLV